MVRARKSQFEVRNWKKKLSVYTKRNQIICISTDVAQLSKATAGSFAFNRFTIFRFLSKKTLGSINAIALLLFLESNTRSYSSTFQLPRPTQSYRFRKIQKWHEKKNQILIGVFNGIRAFITSLYVKFSDKN